jgi:threonine dehydrogenase-like Zn-dependent dehydrogenase
MIAVWLEDKRVSIRTDIAIPQVGEDELLIKVNLAGICGTDLGILHGYYPFSGILGHEFTGTVAAAPGDPGWIGKRVVGEINIACGQCRLCQMGLTRHCLQRKVIGIRNKDGAFAEYISLPTRNIHFVPDSVSNEQAVFTEPLAAALEIQEQIHIEPEMTILLIGAGRLGQLIAQTLALMPCGLQVLARNPRAQQALAARKITTIAEKDILKGFYDVVIEASGTAEGYSLAKQAVRPAGTMVLKSTYAEQARVNLSSLVVDEIRVVGSRCGPFEPALRLLEKGLVDPTILIDKELPLSRACEGLEEATKPGVLKILLRPGES